mmetsp:Transcript_59903/g.177611  ORF Transcript_59903/g.177611 Transcript_59903/m.177611 type:complete len:91 (-) Transcript_59903:97-369(-)
MKRLNAYQFAASAGPALGATAPPVSASIVRDGGASGGGNSDIAMILCEIRDELRELRKAGQADSSVGDSVAAAVDGIAGSLKEGEMGKSE